MRRRDDRGVGTVLGVMLGVVVMGTGVVISAVVSISVAHQRAAVAADLSAIAGAAHGCPAAEQVAMAQGALGVACHIEAKDAIVTVAMPAPEALQRVAAWSGRQAPVIASTSRAGVASP